MRSIPEHCLQKWSCCRYQLRKGETSVRGLLQFRILYLKKGPRKEKRGLSLGIPVPNQVRVQEEGGRGIRLSCVRLGLRTPVALTVSCVPCSTLRSALVDAGFVEENIRKLNARLQEVERPQRTVRRQRRLVMIPAQKERRASPRGEITRLLRVASKQLLRTSQKGVPVV